MLAALEQTLRHEVQHAIQHVSGIEAGSNTSYWDHVLNTLRDQVRELDKAALEMENVFGYDEGDYAYFYANGDQDFYLDVLFGDSRQTYSDLVDMRDRLMKFLRSNNAYSLYYHNPGEMEARAA